MNYLAKIVSVLPGQGKMLVGFWKYFEEIKQASANEVISNAKNDGTKNCFWLRPLKDISQEDLQ